MNKKLNFLILCFFIIFLSSCCFFQTNFHSIEYGKAYRSGQMGEYDLKKVISKYHLATVINLRGADEEDDAYLTEKQVCKTKGVDLYSLTFSPTELPSKKNLIQLIHILEMARYPILIHCWLGADRTGLASVLYRMVIEQDKLDKALEQLSLTYCHLSIGPTGAINEFFELYRLHNKGKSIKQWIVEDYSQEKYE